MGNRLSPLEQKVLDQIGMIEPKIVAEHLMISESTVRVVLYRIRKKYKDARGFINMIENKRKQYPGLNKYMRTRERKKRPLEVRSE